jgi:CBS domain-containing protein
MTTDVASVPPEATRKEIARLLLSRGISAVPVVDGAGSPIGMVSEGDLIGREEPARKERRDWWLAMLAEGEQLSEAYVASVGGREATARDLMSAPLVAVEEDSEATEIAALLVKHRIKRVPVLRQGRMVGIVSRADLLRALVPAPQAPARASPDLPPLPPPVKPATPSPGPAPKPNASGASAEDFRHLASDYEHLRRQRADEARRAQAQERQARTKELIDHHIADESWQRLIHLARAAAEHGAREFLLLRFPNELTTDNGRAINVGEADWPASLRGEAAELHLRWKQDLRPLGFGLTARILEFPNGMPGDAGLFLSWS